MEFNKNQGNRPQSSPRINQPANYGFASEQTRLGGHMIPEMGRNQHEFFPNHHLQMQPNLYCLPGPAVYSHDMNETIQREIEKRRIREEIIMSEMIRRRELEAEVRRELLIERELASRQMGSDGFRFGLSPIMGFDSSMRLPLPGISLEERIAPSVEGRDRIASNGVEPVPFQRGTPRLRISEVDPVVQAPVEKKKIILLAKPDTKTSGSKRKAETTPIVDTNEPSSDIIFKKKVKEEWKCEICQISCTGEQALKDHFIGKKHRSKKAAAITRDGKNYSIGLVSVNATQPAQVASEAMKSESGEKNGDMKKYKFWCDICQVGANTKRVMKNHERGKKHLNRSLKPRNIEVPVNKVDEYGKGVSFENVEEPKDDSNVVFKVYEEGKGVSFENVEKSKEDSNAVVKVDEDGKGISFENVAETKYDSDTVVNVDEYGKRTSFENVAEPKNDSNVVAKVDEDGKHVSFVNIEEPKENVAEPNDDSNAVVKVDEDGKRLSFENVEDPNDDSN